MPCMGPSVNEQEIDKAYAEVLVLLKDRYDVQRYPPYFDKDRAETLRKVHNQLLRDAIHDLFVQQACEDF